jgi:hypothetical protein
MNSIARTGPTGFDVYCHDDAGMPVDPRRRVAGEAVALDPILSYSAIPIPN